MENAKILVILFACWTKGCGLRALIGRLSYFFNASCILQALTTLLRYLLNGRLHFMCS